MIKQTNTRQNGHVVLAAIIGLIVVIAGFLAWQYVRSHSDKNKEPSQPTPTARTEPTEERLSAPKISDPSEGGKYLVIQEWGVRFPLSEELKNDVKYGIFTYSSGDKQTAYFASNRVVAHAPGGNCDLEPASETYGQGIDGGTVALGRSKIKPTETDPKLYFQLEDHWYVMGFGSASCYDGDTGQETGKFKLHMGNALKQLQLIPASEN
jgi:hypothetical protein